VDEALLRRLMTDHQAVFLATGADSHQALTIQGEDLEGVVHGIPFLRKAELQARARGADVAVIGGGNTAMDTARTALRQGAKTVTVLYRRGRSEMPAFADEVAEAEEEGVIFRFLSGPVGFVGRDGRVQALRLIKTRLGASGTDGRLRPEAIPGSEWKLPCDLAIIGAGQVPEQAAMLRDLKWEGGRVWIDETGRTSRNGLFAGGDLTPVRASVVDAMASGKRAAVSIHMALTGNQDRDDILGITLGEGPGFSIEAFFNPPPRWKPEVVVGLDELDRLTANRKPPVDLPHRPGTERIASFDEVALSLNAEQAGQEAGRCFFCGTCVGCDRCYVFCPEGAVIPPEEEGGAYQANDVFCKGCGTCSSGCIRGVLETGN
jgi:NADPH-dependent glutamate synthase beta subunit-like oxidoreductase